MSGDEATAALVARLGDALVARGATIVAAESCTGGLVAAACTSRAGSSAWFERGVVTYSNAAKTELLGVPETLIAAHGAVSGEVARAMAAGAIAQTPATFAVAVTGIAGPDGGTPAKPVGTVVIAVIVPEQPVYVRTYTFIGGRTMVKFQATQAAMDRVRRMLL